MMQQQEAHLRRLKIMGITLLALACSFCAIAYFSPTNETNFWLSTKNKEGVYVLSLLFVFFGLYCLGAIWRKKNFIF